MEQPQQIIVMSREELIILITEIVTRLLNQGITPYPSREDGSTTKVYTRNEVAEILKCSPNNVTGYIRKKLLHASVFNRQYRISEKSLLKFINQNSKC